MKSTTIAVMLLAFATWLYPINVASANETNFENSTWINYEQFHSKTTKTVIPKTTSQRATAVYTGRTYSKEEVKQLILDYSQQYGVSPIIPLAIARCESGYRWDAKNKSSSASGVYQWLSSSWSNQPASVNNTVSVFDADANVKAAVWLIAHGKTSPWNASINCWK